MLPNIVKQSGIVKTAQVVFGGFDRRPDARDGTFAKTQNMTTDRYPLLASRGKRQVYLYEIQAGHCNAIGMGDGLFCEQDGHLYYNMIEIGQSSYQGSQMPVRFGHKVLLPISRELVDLTLRPKGSVSQVSGLPEDPAAGDVYVVMNNGEGEGPHFYRYENSDWADKGPVIEELEQEMELAAGLFRSGSYVGEAAMNNTIEHINYEGLLEGDAVNFKKHFKPGDAVTIKSGFREFDQTLIVREVTETELRFYEYSFPYLVGRYTVPLKDSWGYEGSVGPGLYEVTGWDRFEPDINNDRKDMKYFVIPSGTTLGPGDFIEYRYQYSQFNPAATSHCYAVIKLYRSDGTEITGVTVSPVSSYDPTTYTNGPLTLNFESIDTGEDLFIGVLGLKISKKWPAELAGVFADSNRLWGWEGHTLRASKLGDPSNWNFFDGTAEDAWAVDVHDPEPFTGGISVHGYPTFFTEHKRYRIYGSTPESYQISETDCIGVRQGCEKSMAVLDDALYYVSRIGVMQDTGAAPVCVSEAFGDLRLSEAVGGGSQKRYYVTGKDRLGRLHNLVLDTRNGVWIDEGSRKVLSYAEAGGVMHETLLMKFSSGGNSGGVAPIFSIENLAIHAYGTGSPIGNGTAEGTISSVAETNDYVMERADAGRVRQANRKRIHRVQLRITLESQASVAVAICYDNEDEWTTVKSLSGDGKRRSYYLPVLPRRCDRFRLRFTGSGDWALESLALEYKSGSAIF